MSGHRLVVEFSADVNPVVQVLKKLGDQVSICLDDQRHPSVRLLVIVLTISLSSKLDCSVFITEHSR
eukprot:1035845-Amphidinium_carterae.1